MDAGSQFVSRPAFEPARENLTVYDVDNVHRGFGGRPAIARGRHSYKGNG